MCSATIHFLSFLSTVQHNTGQYWCAPKQTPPTSRAQAISDTALHCQGEALQRSTVQHSTAQRNTHANAVYNNTYIYIHYIYICIYIYVFLWFPTIKFDRQIRPPCKQGANKGRISTVQYRTVHCIFISYSTCPIHVPHFLFRPSYNKCSTVQHNTVQYWCARQKKHSRQASLKQGSTPPTRVTGAPAKTLSATGRRLEETSPLNTSLAAASISRKLARTGTDAT